jgi:hypothetical protein
MEKIWLENYWFDPTDNGHERIQEWLLKAGMGGALGIHGCAKACFHSRITHKSGNI